MKLFKKAAVAEGDIDSSDLTGSSMSHQDAHRDMSYTTPNPLMQMLTVCKTQLLLYSKGQVSMVILVLLCAFLPLMTAAGYMNVGIEISSTYMGNLLSMMPLLILLCMMLFCGAALSVEFNDGVGRLNFPLPVPRWAFFFGKYLASLIASLAFAFLMYGLAWAMTAASFTTMLPSLYTESLVLTVLCVFMCNAICFAVGSVIKRSGGMSFALIFAIMPMALLMVSGFITLDIKAAIEWLPFEAIDMIVCNFGVAPYTLSGLMVYGIQGYTIPMVDCYLQCLIWGIGCLVLGYVSTVRKEVR